MKVSQYDRINVPLFKNGAQNGYICSMCGQYTSYNDSASKEGYNLMCNRCIWKICNLTDLTTGELIGKLQSVGIRKELQKGVEEYDSM